MTLRLAVVTAHAGADSLAAATASWGPEVSVYTMDGRDGMLPAYQRGFERTKEDYDLLAFIHDDVLIHDPDWVRRVSVEFEDEKVGLVGFGGGLGHGSRELYKVPYDYHQLGRSNFLSNMTDAENHGHRFMGACDVAVLDGFALVVRREVLEKCVGSDGDGQVRVGWPLNSAIGYVCYDYWLCCMTRRLGYRIRLVGVNCTHLGGQTFVKLGIGRDPKHWEQYVESHRYIYDEFKDVLPFYVGFPLPASTR